MSCDPFNKRVREVAAWYGAPFRTDGAAVYRWWGCVQMMLLCTDGGDGAVRRRVACCRFTDICDRRNAALFREKMEVVCASETSAKLHGVMPLT